MYNGGHFVCYMIMSTHSKWQTRYSNLVLIKKNRASFKYGAVNPVSTCATAAHYKWIILWPELFLAHCILLSGGFSSFKFSNRTIGTEPWS